MISIMVLLFCGLLTLTSLAVESWLGLVIAAAICLTVLIIPFQGFDERENTETIQLTNLKRSSLDDAIYYVEVKGNKAFYACDFGEQFEIEGEIHKEKFVRGTVIICESTKCKEPVMKKFISEPKRGWFSALFPNKKEYVFYLPKGTALWGRKMYEKKELDSIVV